MNLLSRFGRWLSEKCAEKRCEIIERQEIIQRYERIIEKWDNDPNQRLKGMGWLIDSR